MPMKTTPMGARMAASYSTSSGPCRASRQFPPHANHCALHVPPVLPIPTASVLPRLAPAAPSSAQIPAPALLPFAEPLLPFAEPPAAKPASPRQAAPPLKPFSA